MRRNLIEAGIGLTALGLGATACAPTVNKPIQKNPIGAASAISSECSRQGVFTTAKTKEQPMKFALGRTFVDSEGGIYTMAIDMPGLFETIRDDNDGPNDPLSVAIEEGSILHLELSPNGQDVTDNHRSVTRGDIQLCNVLKVTWRANKITSIVWNLSKIR